MTTRFNLIAALVLPAAASPAMADLPGTLNFHNVTATRLVPTTPEIASNAKEVEFGDFDEDNDLDVAISNAYSDFGARKNKLYRNDGGTFIEITTAGAIPGFAIDQVSRNAFFRDFDGDGHLDLYIVNDGNADADQLFRATWAGGAFDHFEEVFNFVVNGSTNTGASYGAWSADFDGDGAKDVYFGNDPNTSQDRLLLGLGTGSFSDVTATNVPAALDYTVDVCGADLNGDGNLDLLLSTSHSDQNKIYYNNLGAGGDPGDFSHAGSSQLLGNPAVHLNAMEAGDFDGDGDQDVYWSDGSGTTTDVILRNDGNDASNKATFTTLGGVPASVAAVTSRKATVADLNEDGRMDILVMKEAATNSRPTILRNVTVNGSIQFVDWTPAPAFPTGNAHKGWHAAVFDSNGDGDLDIVLGGWSGDHLFEHEASSEYNEGDLVDGCTIPGAFNGEPAAVVGTVGPPMPDTYAINSLTPSAILSVVLNGADDYRVEILDGADVVLATVDRGGTGVEEASTFDPETMPATVRVRVTALACAGPNISGDCGVGISDFLALLAAWGPNPGHPADLDGDNDVGCTDMLLALGAWGESNYILEVLARDG